MNDVERTTAEIKRFPQSAPRFWISMAIDVLDHEIVGPNVKTPKPADPRRTAWQPFSVWFWMLAEAAYRPRTRVIKGQTVHLQRGQLAMAERYLAVTANWSRKSAAVFLERLAKFDMVHLSSATRDNQLMLDFAGSKRGHRRGQLLTVVTICNYDKYQFGLHSKGATEGAAKGPTGGQYLTSDKGRHRLRRSYTKVVPYKDAREGFEGPSGTDGAEGERLPFSEASLAACEAMGFTRDTLVDRYYRRTKGKRINDPSAYLLEMAVDMAAKARGVPKAAVRKTTSKNKDERAEGYAEVTGVAKEPSEPMRTLVTKRVKRANLNPVEMFTAWRTAMKGTSMLNPDRNVDLFCSEWIKQRRSAA